MVQLFFFSNVECENKKLSDKNTEEQLHEKNNLTTVANSLYFVTSHHELQRVILFSSNASIAHANVPLHPFFILFYVFAPLHLLRRFRRQDIRHGNAVQLCNGLQIDGK